MTIRQGNKIIAGNINVEDYNTLQNKPQINSVELSGNKTLEELGIQASGDYALKSTTLAGYGITDGLSTSQITNCITKIPQDIKLELSEDGTLTLKEGSSYYKCDGNFTKYITSQDFSRKPAVSAQLFMYIDENNNFAEYFVDRFFSGNSAPSVSTPTAFWYDTTTKKMKKTLDTGGSWFESNISLPMALVTCDATQGITSIDQVFNGFGYIGSTAFVLPGVEGLSPNGRNVDGSLNYRKFTVSSVLTRTNPIGANLAYFRLREDSFIDMGKNTYFEQEEEPSNALYSIWYKPSENIMRYVANTAGQWVQSFSIYAITASADSTGRITSFSPNNVFQAVDRSDTQWASTQGKPSNKWIDLTLGASGTQYTAPANGWVCLRKQATAVGQYAELVTGKIGSICYSGQATTVAEIYIPVSKGEQFTSFYSVAGETELFRFIYDEGEK